jgi:hypothetical protein
MFQPNNFIVNEIYDQRNRRGIFITNKTANSNQPQNRLSNTTQSQPQLSNTILNQQSNIPIIQNTRNLNNIGPEICLQYRSIEELPYELIVPCMREFPSHFITHFE